MNSTRRNFIGLSFAGFVPAFLRTPKKYESEFGLGEYISHSLCLTDASQAYERESITLPSKFPDNYFVRYVTFPIENVLTIKYKHGKETYLTWNCKKSLIKKINEMSIEELIKHKVSMENEEKWASKIEIEDKKFVLQSVVKV